MEKRKREEGKGEGSRIKERKEKEGERKQSWKNQSNRKVNAIEKKTNKR